MRRPAAWRAPWDSGALVVGPRHALADTSCMPADEDGASMCLAGIRSDAVQATIASAGEQRRSQWCWAASIAMVFRYYGFEVSQARIVAETFGQVADVPGSAQQILMALGRTWTDDHGRAFRVTAALGSPETAAEDLAANRPLIVGTYGHAMVLTAVGYTQSPWYGASITSAIVRDPWPGRGP